MGLLSKFGRILGGEREKSAYDGLWVRGDSTATFPPFTQAQVNDEVSVTVGAEVRAVYKDHEWIYVERADGRRGFIPDDHCRIRVPLSYDPTQSTSPVPPLQPRPKISRRDSEKIKRELLKHNRCLEPHSQPDATARHPISAHTMQRRPQETKGKALLRRADTFHAGDKLDESNLERFLKSLPVEKHEGQPFVKAPQGTVRVREPFENRNAEEVAIARGEQVTLLNTSDPDWTLVRNQAGEEGFVPSHCLAGFPVLTENRPALDVLVVESYRSDAKLDLEVAHGEWLKCEQPEVNGWFWAEKLDGSAKGFVPSAFCIVATHI
ncbi:unnamed protein product, partial [Mesorhabditis spiculigera]